MLELFVKRDTYSYEMDSRRSLQNVGGSGEGAVVVYGGQAPAEGDDRVESPNAEFIPEEREPCEDANDDSSSEESWPNSVREEVEEEEEDVELPLPSMGVPPLEENDAPYPDPWVGVMDMDVTYRNTMVPGVDDDNVPPPVGIGVGQRFMTKDALVMHLKDYCISRHVQFRVHKSGSTVYFVRCTDDAMMNTCKIRRCNDEHTCLNVELCMDNRLCTSTVISNLIMPNVRTSFTLSLYEIIQLVKDKYHIHVNYSRAWRARNKTLVAVFGGGMSQTVAQYDHEIQILEKACPGAKTELTEDLSPEKWALAYDGNMSFGKLTTNSSESVNSLLKRARSLPVQALASAIFYRMNALFVHRREKVCRGYNPSLSFDISGSMRPCHCGVRGNTLRHSSMTSAYYYAATNDGCMSDHLMCLHGEVLGFGEGPVVLPPGPKRTIAPLLYDRDSHRSESIWHGEVTPPEDVEHVTRISRKGRAGEDWALYHRDYIARWEARAEYVITGSRAHTPRHAPSAYMRWYLGVTRRYIAPPPTKPAMVYHPSGYTEEALLGCVRNVVERVNHRAALYPSSTNPHWLEIGQVLSVPSCTIFHSWRERSSAKTKSPAGEPSLTWSSQPERELPAASCKGVGPRLGGDFVLRTMTRFQPHPSLRCSIFHVSRHTRPRSPAHPLSSLSATHGSLSPAATLPLGGFITREGEKKAIGARA
ncbi:hypothetical protein H6P81_012158 [Aristolochia fimbriata]|uniref:Uncharacterized protein n=1 Tax=Aristolochia fimbriata TaxID=158543 RepID=A0AAV7EB11_ARIFI|nr:hypothetical protein H6P81_012158 [Aristolochia fimbriata]